MICAPGGTERKAGRRLRAHLCGAVAAAALLGPAALAAQELNPALTFDFSSSLNVTDNYDLDNDPAGTTTYMDNRLGLNFVSETDVTRLSFGASGVLRLADYPDRGQETDFDDETLRFEYARSGANSEVSARAYYNRSDIAFFDPFRLIDEGEDIDSEDLTVVSGYRETLNGGVTLRTGLSSPLSFSLSANTRMRNFIETDDPSLYDTLTNSLSAGLGFRVSPATQFFIDGTYRDYSADDIEETDRITQSLSFGVAHDLARGLSLNGSLGYQTSETEETNLAGERFISEENDGLIASFGAVQEMPNGILGLNGSLTRNSDGARTSVSVNRELDLTEEGNLAMSLGVSQGDSDKISGIGYLRYEHDLTRGNITAALSQSVNSNNDDEDVQVTSARIGFLHELTPLSDVRFAVSYAKTDNLNNDDDRERSQFSASYSHDLTRDWELSGGYEFTQLDRQSGRAQENSFFLTIQRQFQTRPW